MNTIRMTPGRRLQLAGLGYLMLYLGSVWHPQGAISALIGVLFYLAVALVLLRAAAPEPLKSEHDPASYHPVQAGKQAFLHRNLPLHPRTMASR